MSFLRGFTGFVLKALYRLEVHGIENIDKAGPNAIIALNHVSFLDPPIAMSLLGKDPVFAIDVGIAQRWWIKPFLKFTRALALDPLKPMATRTIINAVRDGETLVIFPEGRITVTGSLMKVYDGAGLIADKAGAMVVPVRIDGPEATIFSRLRRSQVRRRWFPKITVTVLEPIWLKVDPELKGRKRRQAAGAALYDIMSNLIFAHHLDRPHGDRSGDRRRRAFTGPNGPRSKTRSPARCLIAACCAPAPCSAPS